MNAERRRRERVEVLVVGSGAGGAVTGALLAEAGCDVLIVEEGAWVEQGTYQPFSLAQMQAQYRNAGLTVALGRPSMSYAEGACAGGGTEVNSGLYHSPPEALIDDWARTWNIEGLQPRDLARHSERVESALGISLLPGPPSAASEALARGAARVGWRSLEVPRWMAYPSGTSDYRGERQSMTRTFLPRATSAGARVWTGACVERIRTDAGRGRAAAIRCRSAGRDERVIVEFEHVFVCGGAIQTPALLQRSGIRRNVGRTLAAHPMVKLAARFASADNCPDDVPVHQVKEFEPALTIGGSASHPGMIALALADNWATFGKSAAAWESMNVYYAAIQSEGRGSVRALPGLRDPVVTYRLTRSDIDRLRSGLARLAHLLLAAGAVEVFPSFAGAPLITGSADIPRMSEAFRRPVARPMTVHLTSTVPMGEDIERCATNSFGRVHGFENVWVNDASLLPTAPGVNPQGTIMAIAHRNSEHFLVHQRRRV
jgi:choline dehydrogenase-like flavoprotein